ARGRSHGHPAPPDRKAAMSSAQFAASGPSRDPETGNYLTREQLEEKYRWRQSYSFNPAEAQYGQFAMDDDGSNVQCLWASINLATSFIWLFTAGAFGLKFRMVFFEDSSKPWGTMVAAVGFISAFLGTAATGCCCDPMEKAYTPFYVVNVVYAVLGFFVSAFEITKSRHTNDWGYLFLALVSAVTCAGSVHMKVLSVLEGSVSSRRHILPWTSTPLAWHVRVPQKRSGPHVHKLQDVIAKAKTLKMDNGMVAPPGCFWHLPPLREHIQDMGFGVLHVTFGCFSLIHLQLIMPQAGSMYTYCDYQDNATKHVDVQLRVHHRGSRFGLVWQD
ncbi:unnamed protein product, partial [Prorocentrum cordatum]